MRRSGFSAPTRYGSRWKVGGAKMGPLVESAASIVQLRHELLLAGDQHARAFARNAAVVRSVRETLSSTLEAQRRRFAGMLTEHVLSVVAKLGVT